LNWCGEKETKYFVDIFFFLNDAAITEIERYAVNPGQACGYMLGKLTFLAARKKAREALGARFDIKSFHDAMLVGGAVPLAMIDGMTERYIALSKTVVQTRT
jgi:uncharacterized protein (DUF885 family)